jgi:hypothetical protein
VPEGVAALVDDMVQKEPARRPHAREVLRRLDAAAPWARWSPEQVLAEARALLPAWG